MTEKTEDNTINLTTNERTQQAITISGNPGKPVGQDGQDNQPQKKNTHNTDTLSAIF